MQKKHLLFFFISTLLLLGFVSISLASEETLEKKGYVGGDTCEGCHTEGYESYSKSVHSRKQVKGPESEDSCETCHGPGAKHVEKGGGRGVNIFAFNKNVSAQERSAKCLVCHEGFPYTSNWDMGRHKAAGLACNDCHSPHADSEKLLKGDQTALCYSCHRSVRAQANRQSHHPIKEGRITCNDCHNPHGGFGPKLIKNDTVNELCYTCHAEKRGPYMWEHPPVEENCLTCHEQHGSNHSRLLRRNTPQLCQNCHAVTGHPGSPYTSFETFTGAAPSNRMYARGCLNCHSNIHGSNGPSTRGQRFVR